MNNNQEMLNRNYNELVELRHVLQKDSSFFDEVSGWQNLDYDNNFLNLIAHLINDKIRNHYSISKSICKMLNLSKREFFNWIELINSNLNL